MPQAYAVILVDNGLLDHDRQDTIRVAQIEADKKFEKLAQDTRKTLVTRDPEPRIMTVPELQQLLPFDAPPNVTGLYFTADIS